MIVKLVWEGATEDWLDLDDAKKGYDQFTFADVSRWLLKRHSETIRQSLGETQNVIGISDAALRFHRRRPDGTSEVIAASDLLAEMADLAPRDGSGAAIIMWSPIPFGGTLNSTFARDALGLQAFLRSRRIMSEDHQMKPITPRRTDFGRGFKLIVADSSLVTRRLCVEPHDEYPASPPLVYCDPTFTDHPCWSGGSLRYARKEGINVWTMDVRRESSAFALIQLINELFTKYEFTLE